MKIIREITPLTQSDCFDITSRVVKELEDPVHYHDDFELHLIVNGKGAKRIVGGHTGELNDLELVLIGSNIQHGWLNHKCKSKEIKELTVHFHKDLFGEQFLKRNQMSNLRKLFELAGQGVLFSQETIAKVVPRLQTLSTQTGFASVIELMFVLHELSISKGFKTLSEGTFPKKPHGDVNRKLDKVFEYMNAHFSLQVTLKEVATIVAMSDASFSRFIKHHTGYTFVDSLNEIRLKHVSRMLIDTTLSVSEIASRCGFNNMANFNRTFKSKKGATPRAFRETHIGKNHFI